MLFRTRPDYEWTFGPEWPFLDGPIGIQHWRLVEWEYQWHWYIVEVLVDQIVDGNVCAMWKTTSCADLPAVMSLAQSTFVLDLKISVVIPAYERPNGQIGIKAVKLIYGWNEGIYEVITIDEDQYYFPLDNSPAAGSERRTLYDKQSRCSTRT